MVLNMKFLYTDTLMHASNSVISVSIRFKSPQRYQEVIKDISYTIEYCYLVILLHFQTQ